MAEKDNITVAKTGDGTVQITFTIPQKDISSAKSDALKSLSESVNVPGFRPGKAPEAEVEKYVDEQKLLEKTLSSILPKLLSEAIKKHSLRPAIYPRFEVLSAEPDKDWQVRAITCELPVVDLGDYKTKITGQLRAKKIWVPGKESAKDKSVPTVEEKAQRETEVINALLENVKPVLPKVLLDEEVNARLSKLLERIEKLGLTLDNYLSSIGKNPQSIRSEYEAQAKEAISLDLILSKIAEVEKLEVDKNDVEQALKIGQSDPKLKEEGDTLERRTIIENILRRRKALDFLMNLS